jgi:hypothetical protein
MASHRTVIAAFIATILMPLGVFAGDLPNAVSSNAPPKIEGTWSGPGGIIKTQPCLDDMKKLCVKVLAGDDSEDSMAELKGQIIIKDVVQSGESNTWEGRYVADGDDLPAKLILKSDTIVQFSACFMGTFCEEQTYTRVGISK